MFTSLEKFDGASYRPLTAAEVKQIAGRAGRYGSSHTSGRVTCMHQVCSTLTAQRACKEGSVFADCVRHAPALL